MNGKEKCQLLKSIRMEIATRYELKYEPTECTYEGNCLGSCPRCEAELKELQRQLTEKGIGHIDLEESIRQQLEDLVPAYDTEDQGDFILEGEVVPQYNEIPSLEGMPYPLNKDMKAMGKPSYQAVYRRKKVLFKECAIAGWKFHAPEDWWDELDEGMELALIREKRNLYDRNAVAVAIPGDYDGDAKNFDFDFIIGYVPRTENELIAKMMDQGWNDVFTAELSTVKEKGSPDSRLRMTIYIQSKEKLEGDERFYAQKLDEEELKYIADELYEKGFVRFRWGGFPLEGRDLPENGDNLFFLYQTNQESILYLMKLIAYGADAAYFLENPEEEFNMPDDCTAFILTNIQGPIVCRNEQLEFLKDYSLSEEQPEGKLPSDVADSFKKLFITEL